MFQRIQCVNKPRGASGSSTIKTRDFAPLGTPLIFSSGFTFAPLHVNFAGMSLPVWKAEVATEKEEAAFILKIVPMKIARANAISFIQQTLAVSGCGQGNDALRVRTQSEPKGDQDVSVRHCRRRNRGSGVHNVVVRSLDGPSGTGVPRFGDDTLSRPNSNQGRFVRA